MPVRKRSSSSIAHDNVEPNLAQTSAPGPLQQIRGMWQFANFCQWIYTFGKAAKIDESIDIDDIEDACLQPESTLLKDLALALLKIISSHRGLTLEIFDGQARKQYIDKSPNNNPFGTEENPQNFQDFDIFTKIRVLQQMSQWTLIHPERLREKMEEQRDLEQTSWRIEPYGWDAEDRTYFVLDDNRIYRMTEALSAPPIKPRKKKSYRSGRRLSKRRRLETDLENEIDTQEDGAAAEAPDDGLGGMSWECLAVTLDEVRKLIDGFRKSRDDNERILRRLLEDHLIPILEQQEGSRKRKALQRERELLNLAKMANAKRSSRIANKIEQQKLEEKERDEIKHQRIQEEARLREEEAQSRRERERDLRLASREDRRKEREARRIRHEEDLAQLSEDSRRLTDGEGRVSERRIHVEIERSRQALKELEDEDEDWIFDCVCGLHGQIDDGTHSVACESCNVWQHSKCLKISKEEAERPEFHFVCGACRRREAAARVRPKAIKLKVNRSSTDSQTGQASQHPEAGDKMLALVDRFASAPETSSMPTGNLTTGLQQQDSRPAVAHSPSAQHVAQDSMEIAGFTSAPRGPVRGYQDAMNRSPSLATNGSSFNNTPRPVSNHESGARTGTIAATPFREPNLTQTPSSRLASCSLTGSTLSTPLISRDIYRAAYVNNGNLPAQAGLSPTKQSPHSSFSSALTRTTSPTKIPPGITLSPTSTKPILTPPMKNTEPLRTPLYQQE